MDWALVLLAGALVTSSGAEPSKSNERKLIAKQIVEIAENDPDAFDGERVRQEGVRYICDPAGYSVKLNDLCKQYARLKR